MFSTTELCIVDWANRRCSIHQSKWSSHSKRFDSWSPCFLSFRIETVALQSDMLNSKPKTVLLKDWIHLHNSLSPSKDATVLDQSTKPREGHSTRQWLLISAEANEDHDHDHLATVSKKISDVWSPFRGEKNNRHDIVQHISIVNWSSYFT